MSTKNSGKNLQFWFNGTERPVLSVVPDLTYPEKDTTDSSTPSPGTDIILGRPTRQVKIDALLDAGLGAELATGTLVAGTKYIVTATATTFHSLYAVGKIFTSDGTETCTSSEKVKPLGLKCSGKSISCTIATVNTPVTNLKFTDTYGTFDTSDSGTSPDGSDFIAGRTKRSSTVQLIQTKEDADLLVSNPVQKAVVFTFFSGGTITGDALFTKKSVDAKAAGDKVVVTYNFSWIGNPVSTITSLLTPAVNEAVKIIFAPGTSTNKDIVGTGIVLSADIDADASTGDPIKVSYSMNIVGLPTEGVAN